jgi:preprotein translocase subunit SecB
MDTSKQPGIKIEAIILVESLFKRLPSIPEQTENAVGFEVKNYITPDKKKLTTEFIAVLNSEGAPVFGRFTLIGIFTVDENENMGLEEFSKSNAPAIILPYVREEIHSRLMKAGLPGMIMIPPINLVAIQKNGPEA